MATKSSGDLPFSSSYTLGAYVFKTTVDAVSGSYSNKYTAKCTNNGKSASKSIIIPDIAKYWYVEANENTADVYVRIIPPEGNLIHPIPAGSGSGTTTYRDGSYNVDTAPGARSFHDSSTAYWLSSSAFTLTIRHYDKNGRPSTPVTYPASLRTINGKPVYVKSFPNNPNLTSTYIVGVVGQANNQDLYSVVYGDAKERSEHVGRFAIDLKEAGGTGEGSDWYDPDDEWPEDPEDPTYTLNLEVTGALSGRHNDPLNDTSYSYLPDVQTAIKDYGCGGNGGYGGGGGGGASTVVVYKFATSRANSKEITVKARRHGYGSGGGQGGKGGKGCILIFY